MTSEFAVNLCASIIILLCLVLTLCAIRLGEFLLFRVFGIGYGVLYPMTIGLTILAVVFWGFTAISVWKDD